MFANSTERAATTSGAGESTTRFQTFEEFWPYYVAMHSQPTTRLVHAVGTLAGGLVAAGALLRLRPRLKRLLLAPVIGYGVAWVAHLLIERNEPAALDHATWSFQADLQMLQMFLEGRDEELTEIARQWLEDHPEDRSPGSLVSSSASE